MKNLKKFITTLLVALMAFAAVPGNAFAQDSYNSQTVTLSGQKQFTVQNEKQKENTYTFNFEAIFNSDLSKQYTGYEITDPTQNAQGVTGTTTFTKDSNYVGLTSTQSFNFGSFDVNKPGTYVFDLSETSSTGGNEGGSILVGGENFKAFVVVQNAENSNELTVTNVYYVKDADLEDVANKKDPNAPIFTNTYKENAASLTVSKNVTGPFGDKTREFEFVVGFEDMTANDFEAVEAVISNGTTIAKDETNKTLTFKLKDTDTITITGVPVGAKYYVQEINVPSEYKVSATVNEEEATLDTTNKLTPDDALTKDGDNVVYTNNADKSPVTGFVMSMLPYVGILVIAGVAVALVMKRRSTSNF